MLAMSNALGRCDRVLALWSAAFFDRARYTTEEWTVALLVVTRSVGDHASSSEEFRSLLDQQPQPSDPSVAPPS